MQLLFQKLIPLQNHKAWSAHIKHGIHLSLFCSPSLFPGGEGEALSFDTLRHSGSLIYAAGDSCLPGILDTSYQLTQGKLALIYIKVQLPKAGQVPTQILVALPYRLLKHMSLRFFKCCFVVRLNRKTAELSEGICNYQLHGRMLAHSPDRHMVLVMD